MSSDEPGLVPQPQSGLSSQQLLFQGDSSLRFARLGGDPGPKPRELGPPSYIQDRFFAPQGVEFRRVLYSGGPDLREPKWNGGSDTHSGVDATDGNEDDDGDHDEDVRAGPAREVASKVGNSTRVVDNAKQNPAEIHLPLGRSGNYTNSVTIAEPDGELFYSQYLQGTEASESRQKDVSVENTCSFSGRKDIAFHSESGELRDILSDPVTGALMDDAMILPCGHSFGGGGIQHVIEMKACPTCSQSVSEDSILPNLSLRAAVEAFQREEDMLFNRSSKRKRERVDQDMNSYADSLMDLSKGRGVQFPFAVTDRVLIKGNKRTPQRFVGREAIVTTQCLNGWYVVKTLDNAESVKLQYRSLAKVSSDSSSKPSSSKTAPNWLQS